MSYILQVCKSDTVDMETTSIKSLFVDNDSIYALMQDGEIILAIDIDPEVSTQAISEWIEKNPKLHEKVISLMG